MKRILFDCAGVLVLMWLATYAVVAGDKTAANAVVIDNFSFSPQTLTVAVGTKVTWINRDDVPHTVVSIDKKTIVSPALDTASRRRAQTTTTARFTRI